MTGRMDTLCLRLLDLARAQHAALAEGNLDEALALFGERLAIEKDIQKFDGFDIGAASPGQSVDGPIGTWNGLSDTGRSTIEEILSVDRETTASVRTAMSEITEMLSVIGKLKLYGAASPGPSPRSGNTAIA